MSENISDEVSQLSYFRDLRERRAWTARMTVLIAVLGLLILNTYLLFLSSDAVIMNIDTARMGSSEQMDRLETRLERIDEELVKVRASVDRMNAARLDVADAGAQKAAK